ncbi:hypothetical protein BJX66DRAFT_340301 [Aspergillus keveii]|uniref:DUF890 domain protein n=1 Tax=Aspergillus keveii TaxID=714993 RepID=A0ABR4FYQ8_9EURO
MSARRDLYKDGVDFTTLALQSPDFAKYLKPNNQLDFTDPNAVRQLTVSLLQRDFDLKVDIPEARLCPPVPNRLNYILWLQDLIDVTGDEYRDGYNHDRKVTGLDIGTGCCSIYPLLGTSMRPNWTFLATDIDDENVRTATHTVKSNDLESRIHVVKINPSDNLVSINIIPDVERLDFTMCNPPFYSSREEMVTSAEAKERPPFSACTGAEVEMVTLGGEVSFVSRMIDESLQLRERVQWYTSMLGKLSSVSVLIERLAEVGNNNYAVTEFVQGNKTRRWAIAWSWGELRPTVAVARGIPNFPRHLLPFPSEYTFELPNSSIDSIGTGVDAELSSLHIKWTWRKDLGLGEGFAPENVWSRQYRRKMKMSGTEEKPEVQERSAALGFKVQLKMDSVEEKTVRVAVRWLKGTDSVLFESFCGMIKRKLEGR